MSSWRPRQDSNLRPCHEKGLLDVELAPPAGFEPATLSLEGTCSVQLSYRGLPMKLPGSEMSAEEAE